MNPLKRIWKRLCIYDLDVSKIKEAFQPPFYFIIINYNLQLQKNGKGLDEKKDEEAFNLTLPDPIIL